MLSQIVGRYHFKKRKEDKKMTDLLQTIDNTEIICTAIVCVCFVLIALIAAIGINIYNYLENKACYENELKIKKNTTITARNQ